MIVIRLNNLKVDQNLQDHNGNTLLHWAILDKNVEIATTLLKHPKINPNPKDNNGHTLLYKAISHENVEKFTMRLNNQMLEPNLRDNHGNTPLHWAISHNDPRVCRLLIDRVADLGIEDVILLKILQAEKSALIEDKEIKFTEAQNKMYELLESNNLLADQEEISEHRNQIMSKMLKNYQFHPPILLPNIQEQDRKKVIETLKNHATNAKELNTLTLCIRQKYPALPKNIMKNYIRPAAIKAGQVFTQSFILKHETADRVKSLFNKALSEIRPQQI